MKNYTHLQKMVNNTFRKLMGCCFFEQVTESYLMDSLESHAKIWCELNNVELDKEKYVSNRYFHLLKLMR